MPGHLLSRRLPWLLCVLSLVFACVASATPQDVIIDWSADGKVDGQADLDLGTVEFVHTAGDLQNAKGLIQAQDPASAPAVIAAIQEAIDREVIGIEPPSADPGIRTAPDVAIPAWLTAAAIGAGVLILTGIGSAVYRRTRRQPI